LKRRSNNNNNNNNNKNMSDEGSNKLNIEKKFIAGILKHPELIYEVGMLVDSSCFSNKTHRLIFQVCQSLSESSKGSSPAIVAKEVSNLGIRSKDNIDIYDYIESISKSPITKKGAVAFAEELAKIRTRKTYHKIGFDLQNFAKNNSSSLSISEVIAGADGIYSDSSHILMDEEEPQLLLKGVKDTVIELSKNPVEEAGFQTSFPEFNRLYGGLRNGNIYAFVARPGQGKTTLLTELCKGVAEKNPGLKVLMLDTEMETMEIKLRTVSSITDIGHWYIETGNWRKNEEMTKKMKSKINDLESDLPIYHKYVAGKPIEQVLNIVRRWYYKEVGQGNPCVLSYDYIKLTGEKVGGNWGEHQAIGRKIDMIKELCKDLNIPILTAMQLNRSGESANKKSSDVIDDSTAISMSDRLQWFASFVAIFRRKTADESLADGPEFGTHKMVPIKERYQGRDAAGHDSRLLRSVRGDDAYVPNYINFNIENFRVSEKGSLRDIIENETNEADIQDSKSYRLKDLQL
jgi:replicative DNA helicase